MSRRAAPKAHCVVRSTEGGPVFRRAAPKANTVVRSTKAYCLVRSTEELL